jgi:membrane protein
MPENIESKLRIVYHWLNKRTYGAVRILRIAIIKFGDSNSSQASAGMAYYAFFSLFPLLLFMIVGASYILEIQSAYDYVMENVFRLLPTAQNLIDANLQQVLQSRGAVGVLGLVGFLWSGSSFFSILARNINQANPNSHRRNFFEDRAVAFGLVGLLTVLLGLSILSNTITSFLPKLDIFFWQGTPIEETVIWRYIIKLIPFAVTLVLLICLYRYVPKHKIRWRGVLIGATISSAGWQLVTKLFSWVLANGLVKYELVYGSLSTVVALMFWIYLISSITLFGAHLSAVIDIYWPADIKNAVKD